MLHGHGDLVWHGGNRVDGVSLVEGFRRFMGEFAGIHVKPSKSCLTCPLSQWRCRAVLTTDSCPAFQAIVSPCNGPQSCLASQDPGRCTWIRQFGNAWATPLPVYNACVNTHLAVYPSICLSIWQPIYLSI